MDDEFERYRDRLPAAMDRIRRNLQATTRIALLESFNAKVMFAAENEKLTFPPGEPGQVLRIMVAKLSVETLAFMGAMNFGSVVGGYHHIRAIIELRAALHYVFADKSLTERRCQQFAEWDRVEVYIRYLQHRDRLAKKKISQAEFDEVVSMAPWVLKVDAGLLSHWATLYGRDEDFLSVPKKRGYWHEPSINAMVRDMDPTGTMADLYSMACKAPHMSPLGHRFAGGGLKLIGWDPCNARHAVELAITTVCQTIDVLNPLLRGGLLPFMREELSQFFGSEPPDGTDGTH